MLNDSLFSSKKEDWCTPADFFKKLDDEFHFTLDPAATEKSAKCKKFYTPEDDGLSKSWAGETVFCNPPYGRDISKWVQKGYEESLNPDTVVVMLIPSRTDTSYWHDYIFNKASDIRFIRGRLTFTDEDGNPNTDGKGHVNSAPFPSAVIVYGKKEN